MGAPATGARINPRLALEQIGNNLSKEEFGTGPTPAAIPADLEAEVSRVPSEKGRLAALKAELEKLSLVALKHPVLAEAENKPASPEDIQNLKTLEQGIQTQIIDPMLNTELKAVEIGVVFYTVLFVAVLATAIGGNSLLATVGSLAIGTGGAVATLQPFQASITNYLRTKRTLENITSAWSVEGKTSLTIIEAKLIKKQLDNFLNQATAMPSAYASASQSPGK